MAFVAPLQDTETVRHEIVSVVGGAGGRRRCVDIVTTIASAIRFVDGYCRRRLRT